MKTNNITKKAEEYGKMLNTAQKGLKRLGLHIHLIDDEALKEHFKDINESMKELDKTSKILKEVRKQLKEQIEIEKEAREVIAERKDYIRFLEKQVRKEKK